MWDKINRKTRKRGARIEAKRTEAKGKPDFSLLRQVQIEKRKSIDDAVGIRNQAILKIGEYKKQLANLVMGSPEYDAVYMLYESAFAAILYAERTLEGGFMEVGLEKRDS